MYFHTTERLWCKLACCIGQHLRCVNDLGRGFVVSRHLHELCKPLRQPRQLLLLLGSQCSVESATRRQIELPVDAQRVVDRPQRRRQCRTVVFEPKRLIRVQLIHFKTRSGPNLVREAGLGAPAPGARAARLWTGPPGNAWTE